MKKIEIFGSHGLENIAGFLAMKIQNGYPESRMNFAMNYLSHYAMVLQ